MSERMTIPLYVQKPPFYTMLKDGLPVPEECIEALRVEVAIARKTHEQAAKSFGNEMH